MTTKDKVQAMLKRNLAGIRDIADEVKSLAEPIDIDDLVKRGLIEKRGSWYKVSDMKALPKGFTGLIYHVAQTKNGTLVKLRKKSQFERLARKFEKLGF